jgi:pimeloyl-ACP methyl ester carboxylesterase
MPYVIKLDPREEHFVIPGPHPNLKLFLRYLPASSPNIAGQRPVLYVHGATFPSAVSIAHRFDGFSWRDALNAAGFDVWALDFYGFGNSDRYEEMEKPPEMHGPLCNAQDAGEQVEAAARFILDHQGVSRLSLVSHSWGSMPAGRFAGKHPAMVDRWVLFGPVARRPPRRYELAPSGPAWRVITVEDQWTRFVEDVPPGEPPVLSRKHFDEWAAYYLDSDNGSRIRNPAGVKVPAGPFNDILRAWHGELGYDPALVQAPVALIRGEWDGIVPDEDARWLFDAFKASAIKRDIKISRGTHLMHLEVMRAALYHEANAFLLGEDQVLSPHLDRTRSDCLISPERDSPALRQYRF